MRAGPLWRSVTIAMSDRNRRHAVRRDGPGATAVGYQTREVLMTDYLVLRLRAHHATLEDEIAEELAKPLPDAVKLKELKKEKLQLRDELHRILRTDERAEARP